MHHLFSCITEKGNIYTINKNKKTLFLTHPQLLPYLYNVDNQSKSEDYYAQKAKYLRKHKILDSIDHTYDGVMTPNAIKKSLANLHQLVFEVTDACNLRCKYCGYGELYGNYDVRHSRLMRFEEAKAIIDYLIGIWNNSVQEFTTKTIFFSFYGGEPLLNMKLIKEVVSYVEKLHIPNRNIAFSMTTNAMLLDCHMEYLVEKKFHLLISLDGNEWNNSYRITPDGQNSFYQNIKHVDCLNKKYPQYFEKYVNFNAVLHNRNSIDEINSFMKERYGKQPRISPLSTAGIRTEKKEAFYQMYRNMSQNLRQSKNYEKYLDEMFINTVEYADTCLFLQQYNGNVYRTYNDLFATSKAFNFIPTGTCIPFSRKLFVTVNGKVLPCEKIGHQYGLGYIHKTGSIELDYEKITNVYNRYYEKLRNLCKTCYRVDSCDRCMFTIENLHTQESIKCPDFMDKEEFTKHASKIITFMEKHSQSYERITEVVVF